MTQEVRHQTDKEAEYYRDMVVSQGSHIENLKTDLAQLTDAYYKLVKRVEELTQERDNLKANLNIQNYWNSDDTGS
tara:strand:+ start:177 stop:404 length:228 start_codon:yes stop_codon:yes gene_type:complete